MLRSRQPVVVESASSAPPVEELLAILDSLDPEHIESLAAGCEDFSVSQGSLFLRIIREQVQMKARRDGLS